MIPSRYVECTDLSKYMDTQRAADTLCDPRVHRPAAFFTSDNKQVKPAIDAADEAAELSVPPAATDKAAAATQVASYDKEGEGPSCLLWTGPPCDQ